MADADAGELGAADVCATCHGEGEVQFNPSRRNDPQCVESARCPDCHGSGAATEACDGEA